MRQLGILQSLVFVILLFSCSLEAAFIQKIQGKRVLIKLDGMSVELGQRVGFLNHTGNSGVLKIVESAKKLPEGYSVGLVVSGYPIVGDQIFLEEEIEQKKQAAKAESKIRKKTNKLSGFTLKFGMDFADKLDATVSGSSASLNIGQSPYLYFGYKEIKRNEYSYSVGYGFEQRKIEGIAGSNFSYSGFELDINYGFSSEKKLTFISSGLLSYSVSDPNDSSKSDPFLGFHVTYGGFWDNNFSYEVGYRYLFHNSDIISASISGLLVRFGYTWGDNK